MEPLGRFLEYSMESLGSILKAPLGQTLGLGLGSGLGGPSIYSLGTPLRTLGNLPRGSIHHDTPSAFPQIGRPRGAFNILSRDSIEYSRNLPRGSIHHYTPKAFPQIVILSRSRRNQVKQNKQTNNIKMTANGGP